MTNRIRTYEAEYYTWLTDKSGMGKAQMRSQQSSGPAGQKASRPAGFQPRRPASFPVR
ncbi:hypothetical protein HYR99_24545 [Candidatus Poribacteria bacterium]|nr:hypothetical protein [Candidatus Poribacteria bacterium]